MLAQQHAEHRGSSGVFASGFNEMHPGCSGTYRQQQFDTAPHQSDRQHKLIALRLIDFINSTTGHARADFAYSGQQTHSI